jgi:heme/copper-type cytochrome/quinol oxidase subunit 2
MPTLTQHISIIYTLLVNIFCTISAILGTVQGLLITYLWYTGRIHGKHFPSLDSEKVVITLLWLLPPLIWYWATLVVDIEMLTAERDEMARRIEEKERGVVRRCLTWLGM